MLWDLNLEIGHSVRTIEQAIEQKREDVTFATSLLESRLIFGNHIEFEKAQKSFHRKACMGLCSLLQKYKSKIYAKNVMVRLII